MTQHCCHSPAGLMYIVYELVIPVHRNIQVATLMIGYIQFHQGLECYHVEEELINCIILTKIPNV